jgi:NAD(P)-dependent dehydrogenase (short-subunit alcohol dehydrogenase family)
MEPGIIFPINNMSEAFDIHGRNAIITGGNGGIGLGIARAMAQSGVNVAVFCRNMEKAADALQELNAIGGKHRAFSCDVTDMESIRQAVALACAEFGDFEILVNNSGISSGGELLDQADDLARWIATIDTDLVGMARVSHEVGKRMRDAQKGGSIINITSNAGSIVNKGMTLGAYAAAKAGGNSLTKTMAWELGKHNIRVNAIAPGFIHAGFTANPSPRMYELVAAQQPLGRLGEAIEVGALAVFLASPASAHITGEIITIDGGYTLAC